MQKGAEGGRRGCGLALLPGKVALWAATQDLRPTGGGAGEGSSFSIAPSAAAPKAAAHPASSAKTRMPVTCDRRRMQCQGVHVPCMAARNDVRN